jgi:hypothetical protein
MDEYGKTIFLNALIQRKEELFGVSTKFDDKQKLWDEVFQECSSAGCVGLVSSDHLRKTTWQNLQRRARYRYERMMSGDPVSLRKVSIFDLK